MSEIKTSSVAESLSLDEKFQELVAVPEQIQDEQIQKEQNSSTGKDKEQVRKYVNLFFSFDIVNSTAYKASTEKWPIIIQALLERIQQLVFKPSEFGLDDCELWRVIGDEIIFVSTIKEQREIVASVDAIFRITQAITYSLRTGSFYENIENATISKEEIHALKKNNSLSIKSAAWIGCVSENSFAGNSYNNYDNIKFHYLLGSNTITEYLGKDIDAGFRIKDYTQDRRLIVSFELAFYILHSLQKSNLYILDYVRLKGVWNDDLYPIIWYHNRIISENCAKLAGIECGRLDFKYSFHYNEFDNNPLVKNYFERDIKIPSNHFAKQLYDIESAVPKIIEDRNMQEKFDYISHILSQPSETTSPNQNNSSLELHGAVVCCNTKDRTIFIIKRTDSRATNPSKWEFGCAKLGSNQSYTHTLTDYYRNKFGLEINLVMNSERKERQPQPIAVYEVEKNGNRKKGIIFTATLQNDVCPGDRHPNYMHTESRWIKESEIDEIPEEDAVPDFHSTIRKVFKDFDSLFLRGVD